jgi:dihydroorotase
MHLGMSLNHAIGKVTKEPARAMGMLGDIGTLQNGAVGDLTLFTVEEGEAGFRDAHGEERTGDRRLKLVSTVRAGRVYAPGVFEAH